MPDASSVPTGGAWGVVCDQNQQAMAGVTVVVAGKAAITNERGLFHVAVEPGDYDVWFYADNCTLGAKVHVASGPTSPVQERIDTSRCKRLQTE